jgi:GNAT superfamily N-acetyltransferase
MINVLAARGADRRAALMLLYQALPERERLDQVEASLAAAEAGGPSLDDLLIARRGRETVGGVLVVRHPGLCGFLWPPAVLQGDPEPEEVSRALLKGVARRMDEAGILFTQCLVNPSDKGTRDELRRNGFPHLADLQFLRRPLATPLPRRKGPEFESVEYDEPHHERFARAIELTYQGTLDCPGLNGVRTGADALESMRGRGPNAETRWRLYQAEGKDIGVILMNAGSEPGTREIVYMGIVPEMRGRGFGTAMLLDELKQMQAAGNEAAGLVVDSKNIYALRIYAELGFFRYALGSVHLRIHPEHRR